MRGIENSTFPLHFLTSYPYPNALCFVLMSPLLSSGKTGENKRVNVSKPFTGMSLHGTKQMDC